MTTKAPKAYIGTSGFAYDKWHGLFYPQDVDKKRLLAYYGQYFNTVEINSSFYHLPTVKAVKGWQKQAPEDFRLCLKISRYLSHNKKLLDPEEPAHWFMQVAKNLKPAHRGPLLLQLPPSLKPSYERLRDTLEAFRHEWGRAHWRIAVEMRDGDWYGRELNALLDEYKAGLVVHDMPDSGTDETNDGADFVYMRFHGPKGDYHGKYAPRDLNGPARKIRRWMEQGRDVFVFFNNDADGYAPRDAGKLAEMVGG
jgi:uncharacterized protein YecE (DUF72 family)